MTPDTGNKQKPPYNGGDEVDMLAVNSPTAHRQAFDWRMVLGVALVLSGVLIFAEQTLHTGYLPALVPLVAGGVLLGAGLRDGKTGYLIGGSIIFGTGLGFLVLWLRFFGGTPLRDIGIGLSGVAFGFILITALSWQVKTLS